MIHPGRIGLAGLLAAAGVAVCLLAPATPARALVTGSRHDFSATGPNGQKSIDKGGVCTPCHSPHFAPHQYGGWPRSMTEEIAYYEQNGSSGANYLPGATLLCYDCHDNNVSADNDPANTVFTNPPQDIARGGTNPVAPFQQLVGYYEMACGQLPNPATPPTDGSPTGGHYWKTDPGGTPNYARGDKIPCSLCHDPHKVATGTNEAFFRASTWNGTTMINLNDLNGYGTDLRASANTREGTGNGRAMCATCHGYSDQGNQQILYGVTVPKPPGLDPGDPLPVPEHLFDNTAGATPCTDCHGHNQVAGCNECHGYPPLVATAFDRVTNPNGQSYPDGAGAHQRHLDALGPNIFNCEICHGPNPGRPTTYWHNENAANCGVPVAANVDIMGLSAYWDPAGNQTTGYVGGGSSVAVPTGYEFTAKGGGDRRCYGLTCHGGPPNAAGALNWTDDLVDEGTGNPVGDGLSICKWCHDETPARIGAAGPFAPNVLGDNDGGASAAGDWSTGTWGADVSGHGKAAGNYDADAVGDGGAPDTTPTPAANKQCTVCHDATYTGTAPTRPHFDGLNAENRLRDAVNGIAAPDEDATCVNCHQNTSGGDAASAVSQVSTHGNDFTGANEEAFTRQCRQCHNVHGANWNGLSGAAPNLGRNLHMVGSWVDANNDGVAQAGEEARVDSNATDATTSITTADLRAILTVNNGENSYDDGFNDGQHESVCVVCHRQAEQWAGHGGDNTVESTALRGAGTHPVGDDCIECHDHDYDNAAATQDGFAPSGCNGCHGTNLTETLAPGAIRGQFWPDGSPRTGLPAQYSYADNEAGAHLNHVAAIAAQIFGQTPAQLVADSESFTRQKVVCSFCHKDPGGAGHFNDDAAAPSGASRVDVLQGGSATNYFQKYTTGTHATYGLTNFTDDTGVGATYSYAAGTCANLVCHNQATTPASWDAPPVWATVVNTRCSNIECHAPATYTNAHLRHVGAATKNYECLECHADNNVTTAPITPVGHGNGKVDMLWTGTGSIEDVNGADNGYYDKDASGGISPGDTAFAYKDTAYARTCALVYCHGGDNAAWGGGDTTPVWDNGAPDSVYCGSCHDGNGTAAPNGDASVIASGNHTDHLTAAWGPMFGNGGCVGTATTGCHTAFDSSWVPTYAATHVDGTVQFADIDLAPAPLATTDRCDQCHSTAAVTVFDAAGTPVSGSGVALVKTQANWDNTAYEVPCLTCHNGTDAGTNFADGTGRAAPNMLGTDAANGSGAEIRGHGLTTGTYPTPGATVPNPAANKYCTVCHDKTVAHLNDADDTTFTPGNRMLTVIEGFTLPAQTPTAACEACHSRAASTADNNNVNRHSNTDYAPPTATTQGRLEAVFAGPECMQCHDPHGMTFNSAGYNIFMITPTITVVPGTDVPNVRFESRTGNYSLNDTLGTPNDDLCVVCHQNTANPGYAMTSNTGGVHATTFYDGDELGHNCVGCHPHNRDNTLATADGFMPVACNACHTYPGLAIDAGTHTNTASHNIHTGDPAVTPVNNYAFRCRTCHIQNNHNESGMNVGDAWPGTASANTDIRFDPTRNSSTNLTYAGNEADSASAAGNGGTGVCAGLYCHGEGANGDGDAFPAQFQGSDTTPQWSVAATGNCGTCHEVSTSTPPIGSQSHPTHVNPFANGGYAIGCQVCHYGTTTDGTTVPAASMPVHVNGSVEVTFNAAADTRVSGASAYNNGGDTGVGAPYFDCSGTYCHSPGTITTSGGPFTDAPELALDWGQASECGNCHGDGAAAPMPAYADGSPKDNKHDKHVVENAYGCQVCHYPTTTDGTTVTTTTNHVNRVYNVDDNPADNPTGLNDFTYSAGSCTASACHGGHTAGGLVPAWSTTPPIACNDCHGFAAGVAAAADTNNFAWNGAAAAATTQSKIAAAEWTGFGHGAQAQTCDDCHDSNASHDLAMNGGNPYRLTAGFTCTDTSSCHTGAASSTVRTHSDEEMIGAGFATSIKRTWPAWDPTCVNCHDPHGDGANVTMIQRELYDKAAFALTGAAPAAPTEQTGLVFTDRATGIGAGSFAWSTQGTPDYSAVCQECHEIAPASGGLVSFHDGPAGGTVAETNHPANPGRCTACHPHGSAFAPSGCEGCHNRNAYDPGGGDAVAPNVMGDGVEIAGEPTHATPKPFDDGSYGYNVNGHGRDADTSGISNGDPININCDGCHDISVPAGTHLDGTLDGHTPALGNNNPFHLVSGFINTSPANQWSVQVQFDNYCWTACHQGAGANNMRHVKDANPAANAMEMGQHNSYATPSNTPPPDMFYDVNITWLGPFNGAPHYGLCVTCHNPHGTNAAPKPDGNGNNFMMIYPWSPAVLCNKCHP